MLKILGRFFLQDADQLLLVFPFHAQVPFPAAAGVAEHGIPVLIVQQQRGTEIDAGLAVVRIPQLSRTFLHQDVHQLFVEIQGQISNIGIPVFKLGVRPHDAGHVVRQVRHRKTAFAVEGRQVAGLDGNVHAPQEFHAGAGAVIVGKTVEQEGADFAVQPAAQLILSFSKIRGFQLHVSSKRVSTRKSYKNAAERRLGAFCGISRSTVYRVFPPVCRDRPYSARQNSGRSISRFSFACRTTASIFSVSFGRSPFRDR